MNSRKSMISATFIHVGASVSSMRITTTSKPSWARCSARATSYSFRHQLDCIHASDRAMSAPRALPRPAASSSELRCAALPDWASNQTDRPQGLRRKEASARTGWRSAWP